MAKKRIISKKSSPSGKAQHDSEIRRAKRAVSAASTESSPPSSAPQPNLPASNAQAGDSLVAEPSAELVPGFMKRLLRAAAPPFTSADKADLSPPENAATEQSVLNLNLSANPLTELARRHVAQARKSLPHPAAATDDHCRQVLTSLAEARIRAAMQHSPNHNRPLSDSPIFDGL